MFPGNSHVPFHLFVITYFRTQLSVKLSSFLHYLKMSIVGFVLFYECFSENSAWKHSQVCNHWVNKQFNDVENEKVEHKKLLWKRKN